MPEAVYIEYTFTIHPLQPASDILMAELGAAGFESFVENDEGLLAYIQKKDWSEKVLEPVTILDHAHFKIDYQLREIEQENWNANWEANFKPIEVGDQCSVRAPFHEKSAASYDIVIEPKMSFGTGHHETTHMMLQHILDHDLTDKSVLDMGCGTGVLAILCAMKGAQRIDAIDVDHWCYLNAQENTARNHCQQITVLEGDSGLLTGKKYDVIIANINRNILLQDIPVYAKCLNTKGVLFLSGFYTEDIPKITAACKQVSLKFEKKLEKNNWVALKYVF